MKKLLNIFLIILGLGIFSSVQAATAPKAISPCDNKTVDFLTPALNWEIVSGAKAYVWEVFLFNPNGQWQKLGGGERLGPNPPTTASIPLTKKLESDNKYRWHVQSQDVSSFSDWSNWCEFNTNNAQSVVVVAGQPTISSINPNQGQMGTAIDIVGANFACGSTRPGNTIIFTGGEKIIEDPSPICESPTVLKTAIPSFPSSVKSIDVQVKVGGKTSNSRPFTIIQPTIPRPGGGVVPAPGSTGGVSRICPITSTKNPSLYSASTTANWKTVAYDGLVPCGKCVVVSDLSLEQAKDEIKKPSGTLSGTGQYSSCQFCHFFVMFNGIVNFLILKIAIPAAILLLVIGGAMFVFAAGNPGMIKKGMDIMKSVAIGLVIMFVAWIVVSTILTFIGVADWTGLRQGWFGINCPIKI